MTKPKIKTRLVSVLIREDIFLEWHRYRRAKRVQHAPELEKAIQEYMVKRK